MSGIWRNHLCVRQCTSIHAILPLRQCPRCWWLARVRRICLLTCVIISDWALHKRLVKLEDVEKPRPSPFTLLFGAFDVWVEREVVPGTLDRRDIVAVVAALRAWEHDGTWGQACSLTVNPHGW